MEGDGDGDGIRGWKGFEILEMRMRMRNKDRVGVFIEKRKGTGHGRKMLTILEPKHILNVEC